MLTSSRFDDRSVMVSANDLKRNFERSGNEAGEAWASGFERSSPRIQKATRRRTRVRRTRRARFAPKRHAFRRSSFSQIGLPAVAGGLVALAPIIADVAGVAASAAQSISLLPAAAAMAGAGLGTLMLASTGLDQALKDIRDPVKLSADLYSLSPAAQNVTLAIRDLLPAFDELRAATQDAVFDGVGTKLNQLTSQLLPQIQTLTTGVGTAFNGMFSGLSKELMTPELQGDIKAIVDNITTAFHNLEPAIAPVTRAIADLAATGSDFLPDLAKSISDAAQGFSDFISEARGSGKLSEFMQDGVDTLKELGSLLKSATELSFRASCRWRQVSRATWPCVVGGHSKRPPRY
jgi:hypothetical protein